jgi:hypothetical protein
VDPRPLTFSLAARVTAESGGRLPRMECDECRLRFDFSAPDESQPGLLVGMCPGCFRLVLVLEISGDRSVVVDLPSPETAELVVQAGAA